MASWWPGRYYSVSTTELDQAQSSEGWQSHRKRSGNPHTTAPLSALRGPVTAGSIYCGKCVPAINRESMLEKSKLGRIATHRPIAEARRAATHAKQVEALRRWNPSELPKWLDEDFYRMEILPRLSGFTIKKIRTAIDVSHPYATLIKRGSKIPHPRHWLPLAELTGHRKQTV